MNIIKFPDKLLNEKCNPIFVFRISDNIYKYDIDNVESIISHMNHIMQKTKSIGLAANQLGYKKRIICVNYKNLKLTMINPTIITKCADFDIKKEKCLSLPGIERKIKRSIAVATIAYFPQPTGCLKLETRCFGRYLARIIQHEIDHLDGITILNKEDNDAF